MAYQRKLQENEAVEGEGREEFSIFWRVKQNPFWYLR
jgi:hypothetical protein